MPITAARSRLRTALRVMVPMAVLALAAGCGMIPPEPKTDAAKSVFTLYNIVFAMGVAVFLGVEGFIVYSVVRYRRRDDRLPPQTHGNTLIEIIWTAIPTVIVLILFVLSVVTLQTVEATSDPAAGGIDIEVDGFQWQWQFRYLDDDDNPDNDVSIVGSPAAPPVMVVPVGEPVRLTLMSRDVIHSFYVPQFLIKRDLIPFPEGVTPNKLEFTVSEEGTYHGQCAEFCGDLHAQMTFSVQAMPRAEFIRWLADAKAGRTPEPSEQPQGEVIELNAADISFDVLDLSAAADTPWTLRLNNQDTVLHNFVILGSDNQVLYKSGDVGPGETADFAVPAIAAGEYTFYCEYHPVPDMTGTITLQ